MKNKVFALLIVPALAFTLVGCKNYRPTEEKTVSVYNLDKLTDSLSDCKVNDIKVRFIKDQGYVPYLSLKQYGSLYDSHYDSGVQTSFTTKGDLVSWTVIKDNSIYFMSQIDFKNKEVVSAGSLSAAFKADDDPRDTFVLTYGNNTEYESKVLGNSYFAHYSFANQDIDYFSYMGDYYLPLGFYDVTYSFDTSLYFFYNYKAIYSSVSVDNFYEKQYEKSGAQYCVISEMMARTSGSATPDYLVNLNSNLFLYVLDNFYGLKNYKQIETAEKYCKAIGTYDALFSSDGAVRSQAYAETLDRLDDNHTALVAGSFAWGGQNITPRQYGTGCINRSKLNKQLTSLRAGATSKAYNAGTSPMISSDGKTALYLFDSFIFGTTDQVFNRDGSIKSEAKVYDSFFNLLDLFKTLKTQGTVENVILDMSTNGGGVLGVLMKVLALISKNNLSNLYYLEAASNQLGIATTMVDSDFNGLYNTGDCFGDDFNIYLLTSDCSFSCGNAFPCLAQKMGCAKIIGQKSGGGECAVAIHYLPNGEYVYHSSNLHIGYYNNVTNVFTGFEGGAQPDIEISNYSYFYNVDRLSSLIQNA